MDARKYLSLKMMNAQHTNIIQGPCLPHCYKCSPAIMILSHISIVYVIACIVYMIFSKHLGTPFKDSLTREQKRLKEQSSHIRGQLFLLGLVAGFLIVFKMKPYKSG